MDTIREMLWSEGTDVWRRLHGKSVFVTGGTGFFGKSLLDLIQYFHRQYSFEVQVHVLTRRPDDLRMARPDLASEEWLNLHAGDVTGFRIPDFPIDFILHMATPADAKMNLREPEKMYDVIVQGTKSLVEFAAERKVQSGLFTSSGAVYGTQPSSITHLNETYAGMPDPSKPGAAYGEGKRVAESLIEAANRDGGAAFMIARCFAFCGPHLDPDGSFAIGNFIRDAVLGHDIAVNGDGKPFRSYLHSDDLILWLLKILLDGVPGRPYNVGSDQDMPIIKVAEAVARAINSKARIQVAQPAPAGATVSRYVPSIARAKEELGLKVWTPLESSILRTAEHYAKTDGKIVRTSERT